MSPLDVFLVGLGGGVVGGVASVCAIVWHLSKTVKKTFRVPTKAKA